MANSKNKNIGRNLFSFDSTVATHPEIDTTASNADYFSNNCTTTASNPIFYYRHRNGTHVDIYNPWDVPTQVDDYSRSDIKWSFRLGSAF